MLFGKQIRSVGCRCSGEAIGQTGEVAILWRMTVEGLHYSLGRSAAIPAAFRFPVRVSDFLAICLTLPETP